MNDAREFLQHLSQACTQCLANDTDELDWPLAKFTEAMAPIKVAVHKRNHGVLVSIFNKFDIEKPVSKTRIQPPRFSPGERVAIYEVVSVLHYQKNEIELGGIANRNGWRYTVKCTKCGGVSVYSQRELLKAAQTHQIDCSLCTWEIKGAKKQAVPRSTPRRLHRYAVGEVVGVYEITGDFRKLHDGSIVYEAKCLNCSKQHNQVKQSVITNSKIAATWFCPSCKPKSNLLEQRGVNKQKLQFEHPSEKDDLKFAEIQKKQEVDSLIKPSNHGNHGVFKDIPDDILKRALSGKW